MLMTENPKLGVRTPEKLIKIRGIDLSGASRDPKEGERLKSDSLSNLSSTPHTVVQITKTIAWVHENAPKFQTPLLVMQVNYARGAKDDPN